jgi:hypothetical protein
MTWNIKPKASYLKKPRSSIPNQLNIEELTCKILLITQKDAPQKNEN